MLDYDQDSEVWMFNDGGNNGGSGGDMNCGLGHVQAGEPPYAKTEGLTEFKGTDAIRKMFEDLFAQLAAGQVTKVGPWNHLAGDGPTVLAGDGQLGNVFLTWRTTGLTGANKLDYATDTFTFKPNRKIAQQNIIVTQPEAACAPGRDKSPAFCGSPGEVKAGICRAWWGPVASQTPTQGQGPALAPLEIAEIMKSYTEESIVQLYDTRTQVYIFFEGLTAIEQMHVDMINIITQYDPNTPFGIQQRLFELSEKTNTALFVFKCTAYDKASMSFTFQNTGDVPKIVRMNMVITTGGSSGLTEVQV